MQTAQTNFLMSMYANTRKRYEANIARMLNEIARTNPESLPPDDPRHPKNAAPPTPPIPPAISAPPAPPTLPTRPTPPAAPTHPTPPAPPPPSVGASPSSTDSAYQTSTKNQDQRTTNPVGQSTRLEGRSPESQEQTSGSAGDCAAVDPLTNDSATNDTSPASPSGSGKIPLVKRLIPRQTHIPRLGNGRVSRHSRLSEDFRRSKEPTMITFSRLMLAGMLSLSTPAICAAWQETPPPTQASEQTKGGSFVIPDGLTDVQKARFEKFKTFQIKGVCNDLDLDRLATLGVNTVRGYTIPAAPLMKEKLDHAHRLGMKMVISEWMPHHGENKGSGSGGKFTFDYNAKEEEMLQKFIEKIEAIGDHPAILMWGLGNEVHLDEPYLRVVNRMSLAIHERYPHHITSLTMINAKQENIEAIKKYAPDIDVLGVQCYSRGAVRGSIKNAEKYWGKPFYMSEFNTNGPWNFGKTQWGVPLDEPVSKKVNDLKDCYKAIDESPLCLGSTIFVWGHAKVYRPTYFSTLLDPDPNGPEKKGMPMDHMLFTPQADVMTEHFTGKPRVGNRAPVLSKIEFAEGGNARLANPGEQMRVNLASEDADGDGVEYVSWILDSTMRSPQRVAGPYKQAAGADHAMVPAPEKPGEYLLMVYAIDNKGGGSASTLPFKVPPPSPSPSPSAPSASPPSSKAP